MTGNPVYVLCPGADISLHGVAASAQLSTGHFSTAFKQFVGVAPHARLRRQRIETAADAGGARRNRCDRFLENRWRSPRARRALARLTALISTEL
jgi:hypothetical protein